MDLSSYQHCEGGKGERERKRENLRYVTLEGKWERSIGREGMGNIMGEKHD